MRRPGAGLLIAAALAVAVLGGCVPGRDSGDGSAGPAPSADDVPTEAEGLDRCAPAAKGLVDAIDKQLAGKNEISNAWTVRSRQYDSVYFTSAVVGGKGKA